MIKLLTYLLAAGLGGMWIGKIAYSIYAYIQLITVQDYMVTGVLWYQVIGFCCGVVIGRYWQTHYKEWSSMRFIFAVRRR